MDANTIVPSELKTGRVLFLISAINNILLGIGFSIGIIIGGLSSGGFACLLGFIPFINIVCCIMDFIAFKKLSALNKPKTLGTIRFAAILEICSIFAFNIVSVTFGLINIIGFNKEHVKSYLRERGIY